MSTERRGGKGFRRLGAVRAGMLGLSRARERELRLSHAWRRAAGAALAERAAVAVRRGVLCVRTDDPAWRAALEPLLPAIAWRMVRRCPELGLQGWRCDDGPLHAIQPVDEPATAAPQGPASTSTEPAGGEEPLARLRRVADRYVARVRTRNGR